MDPSLSFSDQEIKDELSRLGYRNIPENKLRDFQRDLNQLVEAEKSKNNSAHSSVSSGSHAVIKETIPKDEIRGSSPAEKDVEEEDTAHNFLRKEDLERHDQQQRNLEERAKVPGHFALFELPSTSARYTRDDVSETDSEYRLMKRKTLRKNEEGTKFIDESMSDAGSVADAHEQMDRLALRDLNSSAKCRAQSAQPWKDPPPYRLSPDDPRLPSVIYSMLDHPHTRNLKRSDPVSRFHEMQQIWTTQKVPGENPRYGLRWNIREQMLTRFVPEKKPQRKYVPNNYIPPPDKKRKALRWQIRMDLAQGIMPVAGFWST